MGDIVGNGAPLFDENDGYIFDPAHLGAADDELRRWAVIAVSRQGLSEHRERLLEMARQDKPDIRRHAIRGLAKLGWPSAIPTLLHIVDTEEGLIVGDAIRALVDLGASELRERLDRLADSKVEWVVQQCRYARARLPSA